VGTSRTSAFAAAFAIGAILFFAWPLARVPRLDVPRAFLHVFGAWTLTVVALWWLSRRLGSAPRRPGERDG
jgi:hypothetical protein